MQSKIYSRKRVALSFFKNTPKAQTSRRKLKVTIPIIWIILIAILTCYSIWKSITPVFETLCKDKAEAVATKITNEETTKVMNKYNYDTFFTIEKDENGNVQMITANVLKINKVTSDIATKIQETLDENEKNKIYILLGTLTGIKFLSGFGPKIGFNIATSGNVETTLKSEFDAKGVNQTIHRVYLEIKTQVSILTASRVIEKDIQNQVLILENVIVGKIPQTYYNFEGTTDSDAFRIVK